MRCRQLAVAVGIVVAALFCSCEHKELCYGESDLIQMHIDVDWIRFETYEVPTGMTLLFYPRGGAGVPVGLLTNEIRYAKAYLPDSAYSVLVFNQSVNEFGSIGFVHMGDTVQAAALAAVQRSAWYTPPEGGERLGAEPEWLGTGRLGVSISAARRAAVPPGGTLYIGQMQPRCVIDTLTVSVVVRGITSLRSVRAYITGMAEGRLLAKDRPLASTVTQLLEMWKIKRNKDTPKTGIIEARVATFGLPHGHAAQPANNVLGLSVMLADGKTQLDFTFDVGARFETDGEHHALHLFISEGITLPDVTPTDTPTSGFNPTVEDWGEEEQREVIM